MCNRVTSRLIDEQCTNLGPKTVLQTVNNAGLDFTAKKVHYSLERILNL